MIELHDFHKFAIVNFRLAQANTCLNALHEHLGDSTQLRPPCLAHVRFDGQKIGCKVLPSCRSVDRSRMGAPGDLEIGRSISRGTPKNENNEVITRRGCADS